MKRKMQSSRLFIILLLIALMAAGCATTTTTTNADGTTTTVKDYSGTYTMARMFGIQVGSLAYSLVPDARVYLESICALTSSGQSASVVQASLKELLGQVWNSANGVGASAVLTALSSLVSTAQIDTRIGELSDSVAMKIFTAAIGGICDGVASASASASNAALKAISALADQDSGIYGQDDAAVREFQAVLLGICSAMTTAPGQESAEQVEEPIPFECGSNDWSQTPWAPGVQGLS